MGVAHARGARTTHAHRCRFYACARRVLGTVHERPARGGAADRGCDVPRPGEVASQRPMPDGAASSKSTVTGSAAWPATRK
ncbi:hypothetical protein GCM10025865_27670 [Paraoerskovia sediminicola]|uniref:Uncharacterized protein n=1 Tax=Paraoerskovia sediminicola TaxID=1138587 RepID=A0ABN6XEY0_9CELL|nr:hypothetical protein GCM10025865_27670 [Paraoerskovia sediminicola]